MFLIRKAFQRWAPYFLSLVAVMCSLSPCLSQTAPPEEGICARVRIKISQEVTITRTAFRATLEISNNPDNVELRNMNVTLDIRNTDGQAANDLFGIKPPVLTGIGDVTGGGTVGPGVTATAVWTIIPTRDAAPDVDTQYSVGGQFSYMEDGKAVTVPLFPATIWVKPDARLFLDYFLVRDVYGDDPFTPRVEPAEPFPLGLILSNRGNGKANNVRITSSQPQIVDNEKGLLIDFKIIGAQVNTDPVSPSLSVNLGNIDPAKTVVAQWMMTSSLQGKFIEYKATFEHIDGLGDPRLSLIDSVTLHELTHAVRVDNPVDDNKPDFLVNDQADETINPEHLPNVLYNSEGATEPVTLPLSAEIDGTITPGNLQVHLSAVVQAGWVYIKTNDPGAEQYRLKRVMRSDGREVRINDNAWTTHRTIRLRGQAPYREHKLHIFDKDSTGSYLLIYEIPSTGNMSIGDIKQMADDQPVDIGGSEGLAVTALFPDCIYVESLDRTCGIKVTGVSAFEGDRVALKGTLATSTDGERYLVATELAKVASGMLQPLGVNLRALWSGDYFYNPSSRAGQKGMVGGVGLNTVGLFVRVVGSVISSDATSFVIDDGSGNGAVKVLLPDGMSAPAKNLFVMVKGVVSVENAGSDLRPVIRVRRLGDISAYNQGPQITDLQITNILSNSADVSWSTEGQASSQILLGTLSGSYPDTIDGPDFVQGHIMHLTGLVPKTTYYFVARSRNYWNNITTTSAEQSFTTADVMLPVLSLSFPSAPRELDTVTATARLANSGGSVSDVKITGITAYPASVIVLTPASPASPLIFGDGALAGGGTLSQDVEFSTSATEFFAKLTITYRDGAGVVRTLTTPWKKIATTADVVIPVLSLSFPIAQRNESTVTATARLANTGGSVSDVKVIGIQPYPASVTILTPASPASPLIFGDGALAGGGTLSQDVEFSASVAEFFAKLTITYRDGTGVVRTLTIPWKKIAAP